jgi:hypothetical protein
MKKIIILAGILCCVTGFQAAVLASDISDTFSEKYNALTPPESSSVHGDYLFEQISLGSEYTVRLLDRIKDQNLSLEDKLDQIIEKFDVLIDQNQKIMKLLEKQKSQGE